MSTEKYAHLGRNVKRLREILGMKQETLATELGADWTQKKISLLEAKGIIERPLLEQIAQVFKIPVDAIENFEETASITNIQNNYEGSNPNAGNVIGNGNDGHFQECTFNAIDKIVELYDALVKSEKEKVAMLQQLLDKK